MKNKLDLWSQQLYRFLHLSKYSKGFVWIFGLITLCFLPLLSEVRFNYNIESFFSNEDPEVVLYEEFKAQFGNENNALLIGIFFNGLLKISPELFPATKHIRLQKIQN